MRHRKITLKHRTSHTRSLPLTCNWSAQPNCHWEHIASVPLSRCDLGLFMYDWDAVCDIWKFSSKYWLSGPVLVYLSGDQSLGQPQENVTFSKRNLLWPLNFLKRLCVSLVCGFCLLNATDAHGFLPLLSLPSSHWEERKQGFSLVMITTENTMANSPVSDCSVNMYNNIKNVYSWIMMERVF